MKSLFLGFFLVSSIITQAQNFTLKSQNLAGQSENIFMFKGMGCDGDNISPQLEWDGIPEGTKSFAITLYDPDAPTGSGWWHWQVFDIPANTKSLDADAGNMLKNIMPKGAIQSRTDFGSYGYGGPCPPVGDKAHRYILTVHALDVETLGLDKDATSAIIGFNIEHHTIQKASLIFYSKR